MRKYGQHFLVSPSIIEGIVDAVPSEVSSVLEIGPGRGALTEKLLARKFPHFTAVEIDPDMEQYLLQHFSAIAGRLVRADFMQIDLHMFLLHILPQLCSQLDFCNCSYNYYMYID